MWWLFGQIWLWLLIAFVLGAGLTALVLRGGRRASSAAAPEGKHERHWERDPSAANETTMIVPPPLVPPTPGEETQFIPATPSYQDTRHWYETGERDHDDYDDYTDYGDHGDYGDHDAYDEDADEAYEDYDNDRPEGHTSTAVPLDAADSADDTAADDDAVDEAPPPDLGHLAGTLPTRREWHARNEWPDEQDERERQPHRGG
ncbi:hypothetical protein ABZ639_27565 [Saccharomonospora sp. NPDC006951]